MHGCGGKCYEISAFFLLIISKAVVVPTVVVPVNAPKRVDAPVVAR